MTVFCGCLTFILSIYYTLPSHQGSGTWTPSKGYDHLAMILVFFNESMMIACTSYCWWLKSWQLIWKVSHVRYCSLFSSWAFYCITGGAMCFSMKQQYVRWRDESIRQKSCWARTVQRRFVVVSCWLLVVVFFMFVPIWSMHGILIFTCWFLGKQVRIYMSHTWILRVLFWISCLFAGGGSLDLKSYKICVFFLAPFGHFLHPLPIFPLYCLPLVNLKLQLHLLWFHAMFSLPQHPSGTSNKHETVHFLNLLAIPWNGFKKHPTWLGKSPSVWW